MYARRPPVFGSIKPTWSTCLPSGRNFGQMKDVAGLIGRTSPDWTEMVEERVIMIPSRLQEPEGIMGKSQIASGVPPSAGIFFIFPSAQNPMNWPSGDQNTE